MIQQCPQKYIGSELIEEINIVESCCNGVLPYTGGMMEQPAYYFELSQRLKNEMSMIEREQMERKRNG